MRTVIQQTDGRHILLKLILGGILLVWAHGCAPDQTEGPYLDPPYTVTILLPDGATQEVSFPTVCLGVTPPDSAWLAQPGPLLPPPEAEPPQRPDENGNSDPQSPDESDPPDATDPPEGEGEEVGEPDPCVESPGTCVGAPPPYDWQLEDFQPLSCGYEAVYGLSTLRDNVTFVVLLAAW